MGGAVAYHTGIAAEDQVARHYTDSGRSIAARRWRAGAGEIDLIVRDGPVVIFVEVKCAETLVLAAERLGQRQMDRIYTAASQFLAGEPAGQDSDVRFEVALVDARGRIEIIENAFGP